MVAAGGFRSLLTPLSNGYMACKKSTFFWTSSPFFLSDSLLSFVAHSSIPLAHLLFNLHTLSFTCRIYSQLLIYNSECIFSFLGRPHHHHNLSASAVECIVLLLSLIFLPLRNMPPSLSSSSRIIPAIHYSIKRTNTALPLRFGRNRRRNGIVSLHNNGRE